MLILVLGAIIADAIKRNVEVFEIVSDGMVFFLITVADLPIPEEIAEILIPFGVLMGAWIFIYELKTLTK